MFQKTIHGQFVKNSWTFMFQKNGPFAFHLFVFGGSAAQNGGLSLFNTHPVQPANSLKTKDLRKRHFWLKIWSPGKPLRLKTLGANSFNNSLTSPPTLHSTRRRNRPYILRRETLHHVRFYVGFADLILHTQHRWLSNFKPALCRVCRECMNPLKTVWGRKPKTRVCARILLTFSSCAVFVVMMRVF